MKMRYRLLALLIIMAFNHAEAKPSAWIEALCKQPGYQCLKVKKKNSWSQLFPNPKDADLVKRINRTNEFLSKGMVLAVPIALDKTSLLAVSPFPQKIDAQHEKLILINLKQLAFAAFDEQGNQIHWGPISAGSSYCEQPDACYKTPTGTFHILRKKGQACYSKSLPERTSGKTGGAFMPYCMFFYKGYALHGSETLPGYNESHGCVRLFNEDAAWLNEHFVQLPDIKGNKSGTKVIITD